MSPQSKNSNRLIGRLARPAATCPLTLRFFGVSLPENAAINPAKGGTENAKKRFDTYPRNQQL